MGEVGLGIANVLEKMRGNVCGMVLTSESSDIPFYEGGILGK